MAEDSLANTTFHTRYGLYEWTVLPMGLTNAPVTFMWAMNNLFTNLLDQGIIVFVNDILVYSHTRDEHIQLLHMVFGKLFEYQLYCKLKKCSFFHTNTTFLGFVVTPEGLKISDTKVNSLPEWLQPTTMKLIQSFLGFAQYFWKFIKTFSMLAEPLTKLMWKNSPFKWGDNQ